MKNIDIMKRIALLAIISIFNFHFSISHAQQTYTQQVPDQVTEIRLEGAARLLVKPTDGETRLQCMNKYVVASVKNNRMNIPDSRHDVTLFLPAGRSMTFKVEDHANLLFIGSFGKRQYLTIETQDYATATFSGSIADSMWAVTLTLKAHDHSLIYSEIRLANHNYYIGSFDYSRISIACFKTINEPDVETRVQSISFDPENKFAHVDWNYCDGDTVRPLGPQGKAFADAVQTKLVHSTFPPAKEEKKKSIWRHRDAALNFAWGFHNWGTGMFNGFEGVEGDAAIRTSFNNIQLSVSYPIIGTRHFGFYVGLGLEWDKYKFEGKDIAFNTSTDPHTFLDGGDATCTSWLNTRYVVMPLTFRFDLWHDWSLTLSALPGIHWSGSHTGLRREYTTDLEERIDYDQSVNKYINPYKLDLRATLSYEGIGLYFQVPTMSTMRSTVQDLYPIKFGLILTID